MNEKLRQLKKGSPDDWPSLALMEFTMALAKAMAASNMKQKDLAKALDVSPPYISNIMSGNENLTVEQMSRLAEAAGGSLHLTIAPKGVYIRWVEDALEETLEEAATEAVAASSSLRGHRTVLNIPMAYPLLEATSRCHGVESLIQAPCARAAGPNVPRLAQQLPPVVASRSPVVPFPARRQVNLLDQSGRFNQ